MALHIISRPLHLTFKHSPTSDKHAHFWIIAHSSPARIFFSSQASPLLIPIKSRWLLSSVFLREEHQTCSWRPRLEMLVIPFMGYIASLSLSERWGNNTYLSVILNSFSMYLKEYALWLSCVHVCTCVHMHDEKQCCCHSINECTLKIYTKHNNR